MTVFKVVLFVVNVHCHMSQDGQLSWVGNMNETLCDGHIETETAVCKVSNMML